MHQEGILGVLGGMGPVSYTHLFELIGWEGSAYMQAQRETAHTLPVLHTTGWAEENGVLTPTPSPAAQARMEEFQNLSTYDRTRFE